MTRSYQTTDQQPNTGDHQSPVFGYLGRCPTRKFCAVPRKIFPGEGMTGYDRDSWSGWRSEGDMTANQYRAALKKIGISNYAAAPWLGISRRAAQGYALGETSVPQPIARLLRLVMQLNLSPDKATKLWARPPGDKPPKAKPRRTNSHARNGARARPARAQPGAQRVRRPGRPKA
jgi:hypothetical protein